MDRLQPSPEWLVRLEPFRSLFTQPGFRFFCAFLLVLAHTEGRLWVTSVVLSGLVDRHFTRFYGFLRQGVWSVQAVGQQVAAQCLPLCLQTGGRLFAAVDDTVCQKRGPRFDSLGFHHDPMSRSPKRLSHGHCFVCLALLAERSAGRFAALFVSCALYVQEKVREEQARKQAARQDRTAEPAPVFQTKLALAVGLIGQLALPAGICLVAVADGAYAKREFVGPVFAMGRHVLSRLRRDAVFYDFPPLVEQGAGRKAGRPRQYGEKRKALDWAQEQAEPWQTLTLGLYGRSITLQVKTREGILRRLGAPARLVAVRWGERPVVFLFSTDRSMSAARIVQAFAARFAIETGFRDAKQFFGLSTYQVRRERSLLRLVHLCLWAQTLMRLVFCNQQPQPIYGRWRKPLEYLTLSQQKRLSQVGCRISERSMGALRNDEYQSAQAVAA